MELCAAAEAAKASNEALKETRDYFRDVFHYSDSKVVLGYLSNTSKSFARYVARRTAIVNALTHDVVWRYVPTSINPADLASRPTSPLDLLKTHWLHGPEFLRQRELPTV